MIKIKLYNLDHHRNECTFRPYLWAQDILKEIGIEFTQGDSYDYAWVAQASITDKKTSLEESTDKGLEFLSKINGDYMLIDGQDSTSLAGVYEVFKESNALLLLKNNLFKDKNLYKKGWNRGRYYWGEGNYLPKDFDLYSDRIISSGTNWISTHWAGVRPNFSNEISLNKQYDISAMFSYPTKKENYEYQHRVDNVYDEHRKPLINIINRLNFKVAKLSNGVRVSQEEYYNKMFNSKIILAPFGYGEIVVRDLEAAIFGCALIKPSMDHIETYPNIYRDGETYMACKHDYSDLEEKIETLLGDPNKFYYITQNARKTIQEQMDPKCLAIHVYNIFKNLDSTENE